jgi:hypothetical protein
MTRVRSTLIVALAVAVALAACGGPPPDPDPDPVPPAISGVAPSVAPRGATVVISGSDFGTSGSLTIGGVPASITGWSDDEIQAVVAVGTPDAWQEIEVTTDVGADAFSPFFVGTAFSGAAADLQDFLDGQPVGTAVLLEAAEYDLSAVLAELRLDNRSLYGRGEAATRLVAANGAIVLANFGVAVTVADLTLETDALIYFHGTEVGGLGTASLSSWQGAHGALAFGTRTLTLPSVASLAANATAAPVAQRAGLEAYDVTGLTHRSSVGLPVARAFTAVAIDEMPTLALAPAGVAYPRITFANVTIAEDAGGGFFGFPGSAIPAVELTLASVTIDAPDTAVFLFASQDVVVEDTDVTAGLVVLVSVAGAVSVTSSELISGSDVNLYAESGLSVASSTVRAEDGNVELVGAVLGLLVGTGLDTGGPVTVVESTIEALDADLADANVVGQLLVTTQFAPIALRDNVLIRSHLDTVIANEASFLGEGDVTLTGNAAVVVGVSQADEPVDYRQSDLVVFTGTGNAPDTVTLEDNVIDATATVIVYAGASEPGHLVARGNDVSAGDGFDAGAVVMYAGSPGTLTLTSNRIASDRLIYAIAPDLDGGSTSLDGNTMAAVGDAGPVVYVESLGGSCDLRDNDVTLEDTGADDATILYLLCFGADATVDAFDVDGNDFGVAGNGNSVAFMLFVEGALAVTGNTVTGEAQLVMQFGNTAGTIAENTLAFGTNATGWILVGSGDTDLVLNGNDASYVDVGGYGLLLQGIGNAAVTGNAFASTGTPLPGALAMVVATSGGGSPVAITASGNTFTNFDRALIFADQAGAALGIDAAVTGNVFDFVIDAAPKVAELSNVADEIDARNNQWGTNTVLATVASYVTLSGDTNVQGGSILLDPITLP